jgi:hypothetical protein
LAARGADGVVLIVGIFPRGSHQHRNRRQRGPARLAQWFG